jgi:hypothetical protein
MPTVDELRGKIWLLQASSIYLSNQLHIDTAVDDRIVTDDKMYYLQNYWNGP